MQGRKCPVVSEAAMAREVRKLFLVASGLWFLGWFWKIDYFVEILAVGWFASPEGMIFPEWMSDYRVAVGFYMLPLVGILVALIRWSRERALFASGAMTLGALGCLGHYQFFNDATFTTAFWAGLWLFWLAWNSEREDPGLVREAKWLVRGTVAMIFLGGAMGKFTQTYWSGEVFYQIYFVQKDYFIYNYLEANFTENQIRTMAKYFSRGAILGEALVVVGALIWKYHWFAWFVIATMLTMVAISTPWLFSVMAPIVGIVVANLLWKKETLERLA